MADRMYRESEAAKTDPILRRLLNDLCEQSSIQSLDVTGGASGAAFTAAHNLGRRPSAFRFRDGDSAGVVYADSDDRVEWDAKKIQFKCDLAAWHGKIDLY